MRISELIKENIGATSLVSKHPSDPNLVIKKEKYFTKTSTNPYREFVKVIQSVQKATNNPYLPYVRIIKTQNNPNKPYESINTYEIENLNEGNEIDVNSVKKIGMTLFNQYEQLLKHFSLDQAGLTDWEQLTSLIAFIADTEDYKVLTDKRLEKALRVIKFVQDKTGSMLDINSQNIMVRPNTVPTQIVIIDPLS